MHVSERDRRIAELLDERGFIALTDLCRQLGASPATVRRDLERLEREGRVKRLRGGARPTTAAADHLAGTPFELNRRRNASAKAAIGRAAAALCAPGEAVIIDGGTTTLQMCPHLPGDLHVLTNSLHIVEALLGRPDIRLTVPGGAVFREQNVILSPYEDDGLSRLHARTMFMGAAAVGPQGLMQADALLVGAERKLMDRADRLVVLADASKLDASAALQACPLERIDLLVTDAGAPPERLAAIRARGVEVRIA